MYEMQNGFLHVMAMNHSKCIYSSVSDTVSIHAKKWLLFKM